MSHDKYIDHGRNSVFLMHVHLVFVTKYRREVFTKEILDDTSDIFSSACADFEAELVEFDDEDDHVHLLVNYPPKVSVSNLVNSLKGGRRTIRVSKRNYGAARFGRPATSPEVAVAHPSRLSDSTSNSSRFRTKVKGKDGFAVRALDPALKGEVCRAADHTIRASH